MEFSELAKHKQTIFSRTIKENDWNEPVTAVRLVGTDTISTAEGLHHWRIFLQGKTPKSAFFALNPIPGGDTVTAVIMLSSNEEEFPHDMAESFYPPAAAPVGAFVHNMVENGLDRYRFTEDGNGCRYWCIKVIESWEKAGLVNPGTVQDVEAFIAAQAAVKPICVPTHAAQGVFY